MSFKKYKEIYREFANEFELINEAISKINLSKNSKILDIGTGIGAMSTLLALNEYNVITGEPEVDPERDGGHHHNHDHEDKGKHHCECPKESYWEFKDWKESARELGVESMISFQNFDAQNLPFEISMFDGIFLYDALQHIPNRDQALNECLRILKPGGYIVVIEWTEEMIEEEYKKNGYRID